MKIYNITNFCKLYKILDNCKHNVMIVTCDGQIYPWHTAGHIFQKLHTTIETPIQIQCTDADDTTNILTNLMEMV